MAPLPGDVVTIEQIIEWDNCKKQLAEVKAREALLRSRIARILFPNPVEGSRNDLPLAQGWILKLTHVINRKLDEAAWKSGAESLRQFGIRPEEVVVYKPELSKSAYNELTEEQRHEVDMYLEIKPGTPSLEIKLPARAAKAQA